MREAIFLISVFGLICIKLSGFGAHHMALENRIKWKKRIYHLKINDLVDFLYIVMSHMKYCFTCLVFFTLAINHLNHLNS